MPSLMEMSHGAMYPNLPEEPTEEDYKALIARMAAMISLLNDHEGAEGWSKGMHENIQILLTDAARIA